MPFILPAAATAIAAAAPAAAATTSLTATLTSVALNAATSLAMSAVMSALQPQVGAAGRVSEWSLDPDGPIPFAAGRIGVAGSAVYRKTFGPDLMYLGIPSVLSGAGPIDGYESFLADEEVVTFDGTGKAVTSQYAGELWFKTTLGTQPDTALVSPTGLKNGTSLTGWTSAHKLSGKATYMVVMGENSKGSAFPTGEIKPLVTLRGLKGWDPRLDSTYPGGSGACRLDDPATWVFIDNPILWALKWSLGLWEGANGGVPQVDHQVGGIGAKLSGIDVPAFVAAANVCDANGWTVSAYPSTDDGKSQVLDAFLQAGGAIYAQRAGKISLIQRASVRTSLVTITAADVVGPLEIDTAASRIDRINTIRPRFWSEAHRWQLTALPEVTVEDWREDDGGTRPRPMDYPYVSNPVQATQLAALAITHTREGIAGVVPLKPYLQRIRPGDAFTISEPGFVLNGVKCLALSTSYDPATGIVSVTFVSETDGKYAYALGLDPDPPEPPVVDIEDPRFVRPPDEDDWAVTVRPPNGDGVQFPGYDLVGAVTNATATSLIVEWGPTDDPTDAGDWVTAYSGPVTATRIPITGMDAGAELYVAISLARGPNFSARTLKGPYVAGQLVGSNDADFQTELDRIASDNWLTRGKKPLFFERQGMMNTEFAGLNAQAIALGIGSPLTDYAASIVAVNDFIDDFDPALTDFTTDTEIDGAAFRDLWTAWSAAKQGLMNAITAAIAADVAQALSDIATMTDDDILSVADKGLFIERYELILGEYAGFAGQLNDLGLTSDLTNYNDAYTDLTVEVDGLDPAYDDLTQDTPVDGPGLRVLFNGYYLAREAGRLAINAKINGDATSALSSISDIFSDNRLTPDEKVRLDREYRRLTSDYTLLIASAASYGVSSTTFSGKVSLLNTLLGGYSPPWNDLTTTTTIVGATLKTRLDEVEDSRSALMVALTSAAGVDGSAALARVIAIAADGILSKEEKSGENAKLDEYTAEYTDLIAAAAALGVTTERTAYITAYGNLTTYTGGLSPLFTDRTQDTVIVRATYVGKFTDYVAAKTALLSAMASSNGGSIVVVKSAQAAGPLIGPAASYPVAQAALTPLDSYPAGGNFTVEVPAMFATSDLNGSVLTASGEVRVVIYHSVDGNTGVTPWTYIEGPDTGAAAAQPVSVLNVEVPNVSAGSVQFQLQARGYGSNTGSSGVIDGVLKTTFVK